MNTRFAGLLMLLLTLLTLHTVSAQDQTDLTTALTEAITPLSETGDYAPLLERIGDARIVLIGEESHGTHEFYQRRADITQQLIEQHGFTAVIVEADWHSAFQVNAYVRGAGTTAEAALGEFERFPVWMWRNTVVLEFVEWLRTHNDRHPTNPVGFYGLDLYGMYGSIEAAQEMLSEVAPDTAGTFQPHYQCFHTLAGDAEEYGAAVTYGGAESCEPQALAQREAALDLVEQGHPDLSPEQSFSLLRNAEVIVSSEAYHRAMYTGSTNTWNLRDLHFADTIDALLEHLDDQGQNARVVVWAHNSHVGDASATELGQGGQWNVGQLMRERHGDDAVLIGFTTYTGTVTAAHNWGEAPQVMQVNPGLRGSYEALFHTLEQDAFLLLLDDPDLLGEPRLERAIGVIYRPQTERQSHYFIADLVTQFDAIIHIDVTRALEPLDPIDSWNTPDGA